MPHSRLGVSPICSAPGARHADGMLRALPLALLHLGVLLAPATVAIATHV
jgi:hypothetical protein